MEEGGGRPHFFITLVLEGGGSRRTKDIRQLSNPEKGTLKYGVTIKAVQQFDFEAFVEWRKLLNPSPSAAAG